MCDLRHRAWGVIALTGMWFVWFPSDGLGQPVPWTNPAIRVLVVGKPKIKWSEPDLQTQRMTARCVFSFDRGDGTIVEKSIELGTKGPMESVTTEEHRYSVLTLDRETWKPARAFPSSLVRGVRPSAKCWTRHASTWEGPRRVSLRRLGSGSVAQTGREANSASRTGSSP